MKLRLRVNEDAVTVFQAAFRDFADVTVRRRDLLSGRADVVVIPSTSFGWLDEPYLSHFGGLEASAQAFIKHRFSGEVLVGQGFHLPTGDEDIATAIIVPIARVPMRIPSINVYLAARLAFCMIKELFLEKTILLPSLDATLPPADVAQSMRHAYTHVFGNSKQGTPAVIPLPKTRDEAIQMTRQGIG